VVRCCKNISYKHDWLTDSAFMMQEYTSSVGSAF
jgi:hypothetical protein